MYVYTCKKHSVCIVRIFASICMHGQHDVCVFEKVPTSNHMHEVARNRTAFRKSKPGRMELVTSLHSSRPIAYFLLSMGLKLLLENMPAHKKPDHELGSVVADYNRSQTRWRVQVNFGNFDWRVGPQRDDRAAADADLEEVRAAGDRDKMRLAIQQLKTATVTQEMPPVTQVIIIGYLIFCVKISL